MPDKICSGAAGEQNQWSDDGEQASFDVLDYVVSLRQGIVDAWDGVISAMKAGEQIDQVVPFVLSISHLLQLIATDMNQSEGLMASSMGLVGDLADAMASSPDPTAVASSSPEAIEAYQNKLNVLAQFFRQDWLTNLVKEVRSNRDYSPRTHDTARWAREQIKRQLNFLSTRVAA